MKPNNEVDFFVDFEVDGEIKSVRADKVSAFTTNGLESVFIFCVSGQPIMVNNTIEEVKNKINKKLNELYIINNNEY